MKFPFFNKYIPKIDPNNPKITKITQKLKEKGIDLPEGILTVDDAFDTIVSLLKKEGKLR